MMGPGAPTAPWLAGPVVNEVIAAPPGWSRAWSVIVTAVSSLVVAVPFCAMVAPNTVTGRAALTSNATSNEVRRRRTFTLTFRDRRGRS